MSAPRSPSAIGRRRRGEATERDVVDAMFDAFAEQGAGELIGWIILTRQREALEPVIDTDRAIIADFRDARRRASRWTRSPWGWSCWRSAIAWSATKSPRPPGQPREAVREIAVAADWRGRRGGQ